ncbi:carbohydrate deacetylase [Methyloprofundus sp.]|uniref:carbohydrate deacetylase n=1 Tax=Methyloprofundus sp. TaxID=2020875 RepID=UPI003D0A9598
MSAKYLIINADDYGFYACTSKGILQGAEHGAITATGFMANSPGFEEYAQWLKPVTELDTGVHLNISYGTPLSIELADYLSPWQGEFPGKLSMVRAILSGKLPVPMIEKEWRLQIERCLRQQIDIKFLNSHEHLHMLPPLYKIFCQLVNEFQLFNSRKTLSEWHTPLTFGALFRNSALSAINVFNSQQSMPQSPKLLGLNASGHLTIAYLNKIFGSLKSGQVYELMCHPGYFDRDEITDPDLLRYHRWEVELNLLLSDEFGQLCVQHGIELINYRQLDELNRKKHNLLSGLEHTK